MLAWVHPWLIALEGEYIRSTLYNAMHATIIREDIMYVGMAWVRPCLIALEGEYIRLPLYGDMHATI